MSLYSRKYLFLHIFENNAGCIGHYIAPDVPRYEPETIDWYWMYSRDAAFGIEKHCGIIYAERIHLRGAKRRFDIFVVDK